MLTITVGGEESFDEEKQEFLIVGGTQLQLEHSLVSLSKWETEHEKPFLDSKARAPEEVFSYIECMLLPTNPPGDFLHKLSNENIKAINAYIDKKATATWFSEIEPQARNQETITSELIYYWMSAFQIDWEAQYWHLNRLFTLIRICGLKQQKPKKMSRADIARRNRELNERRKAEFGTKG